MSSMNLSIGDVQIGSVNLKIGNCLSYSLPYYIGFNEYQSVSILMLNWPIGLDSPC